MKSNYEMGSLDTPFEERSGPLDHRNHWRSIMSQHARPKWWQIYLTLPLLIALFVVDSQLKISTRGHQAVQIGIILLIYGLIHLWLKANARALSKMDRIQDHGTFKVIHIPSYQFLDKDKRPMFRLPDSELKGVLSDTFELDTIDAEFVQQEQSDGRLDGAAKPSAVSRPSD